MTERKEAEPRTLGKDCKTKGKDDVCSYCGSVLPDYCNKADADKREAAKKAAEANTKKDAK